MENKQSPSNKKLISIEEEKLIREVDYDSLIKGTSRAPKRSLLLDLEIFQKNSSHKSSSQRVLVSIKPRAPAIKTIYIAERSRYTAKKGSDRSSSRLGIGDHPSFNSHNTDTNVTHSIVSDAKEKNTSEIETGESLNGESSIIFSKCPCVNDPNKSNTYHTNQRPVEKCYIYTQPQLNNMNIPKLGINTDKQISKPNRVDIATLIVTNTTSENSTPPINADIHLLQKRIDQLERKILKQEIIFRSIGPNMHISSSDDETKEPKNTTSENGRPGCSYIQQYSHVPETSAFQRYAQQALPLSPSKATTLEKEHNSEQYGRDFTAYDGITARGRRQCASVPCKRDDGPKLAAERVHKIRHKLNPVRDYRLMDTVHYLAQGEFAPRDDGIKLTPSREGVLSDIIWEDVCRTHWPNARLNRRERCSTRCELQRLIDCLLRERVAHVERRRRRHYRIVKLNHRHESCRPVGKTGDIIVASHKNRQGEDVTISDHNAASAMLSPRRWEDKNLRRSPRSHDRLSIGYRQNLRSRDQRHSHEDDSPGPSCVANRAINNREPTCCYQAASSVKPRRVENKNVIRRGDSRELTSGSSSSCKPKAPRLVIKKDVSKRKHLTREEPNLEHYILLPTLVVRTPSNMKRQKKFNELYHRILNHQINNNNIRQNQPVSSEPAHDTTSGPLKRNVGLNINITLSDSEQNCS